MIKITSQNHSSVHMVVYHYHQWNIEFIQLINFYSSLVYEDKQSRDIHHFIKILISLSSS